MFLLAPTISTHGIKPGGNLNLGGGKGLAPLPPLPPPGDGWVSLYVLRKKIYRRTCIDTLQHTKATSQT